MQPGRLVGCVIRQVVRTRELRRRRLGADWPGRPKEFEARALDMMPAAFAAFPDKDYCVVTVPQTAAEPPLLGQFSRAVR